MCTVPAQSFCAPTRANVMAAWRSMPGVWAVFGSSWSACTTRTPSCFQRGVESGGDVLMTVILKGGSPILAPQRSPAPLPGIDLQLHERLAAAAGGERQADAAAGRADVQHGAGRAAPGVGERLRGLGLLVAARALEALPLQDQPHRAIRRQVPDPQQLRRA